MTEIFYVLIQSYSDKSAFHVCGITRNLEVATAWYVANDENDVFVCNPNDPPKHYLNSIPGWREKERDGTLSVVSPETKPQKS